MVNGDLMGRSLTLPTLEFDGTSSSHWQCLYGNAGWESIDVFDSACTIEAREALLVLGIRLVSA